MCEGTVCTPNMHTRRHYKHVIYFLGLLVASFILLLLWNTSILRFERPWHDYQWTFSRGNLTPSCSTASNSTVSSNLNSGLIVHFVRLYPVPNPNVKDHSLNTLECLGIYSVLLNLKPRSIYLHTNVPSFWPFDTCESLLEVTIDWSPVTVLCASLQFTIGGKRFSHIAHDADYRKFKAVEEYGGLVMDFDVYVISGALIRSLMDQHRYPCIVCHEVDKLNAGFFGCRTAHAKYPQLVLESYRQNYNPHCWLCSSGGEPFKILKENNDTAAVVDGVCDHRSGVVEAENWATLPAFHSYWHKSPFTVEDARQLESTLGDVFRWLLKGAPASLAGKKIPTE